MTRFDPAPADGGISYAAQEDEARERAEELEREAYLVELRNELFKRADTLARTLGPVAEHPLSRVRQMILRELVLAVKDGVTRAESGRHAEWILETHP